MKIAGVVTIVLAIALAVVPMFSDCQSQGRMLTLDNGKQVSMKCHWTGLAELALSVPLAAVGLMMIFSRKQESRRTLGLTGISLGIMAILLPTVIIGVCMDPHMTCVSIMKPSLILAGALALGIGIVVLVVARGKEKDLA
jgi:uncharacterized membrane protein YkvI